MMKVCEQSEAEAALVQQWGWLLAGRQLLLETLPQELQVALRELDDTDQQIQLVPGAFAQGSRWYCQRCGSRLRADQRLPSGQLYCTACLALGRVCQNSQLVRFPSANHFPVQTPVLTWRGQLTPQQAKLTQSLLAGYQQGAPVQLLWAVTGAGKTEITFKVIADYLARGLRVGFVSPRVDVCNEIYPRLQQAFAQTAMGLHHGQVKAKPQAEQLVVATIHQLVRYYQAFDLLIVDEVDAFPYVGDPMLERVMRQAVQPQGQRLYLSATPPASMRRAARHGQLPLHYLARRFHGRPLVQPRVVFGQVFQQDQWTGRLRRLLTPWLSRQRRILIFVPQAASLPRYLAALQRAFPSVQAQTVHAQDPQRLEKVAEFRAGQGQVLLTTTILERGVTLPHVDVLVLAADHPNFNVASLVQIAGRVGRAPTNQGDQVVFYCQYESWAISQACHQIRQLNHRGGF